MVVAFRFAIVAAGAIAEIDFEHEAGVFQVAQRVVNGCVADTGQALPSSLKDIAGSGVVSPLLDYLENRLSLGSQLWFLLGYFHSGFRLILNPWIVKRGVALHEVDDLVDVALERRAPDSVWSEKLLRLGRIVELLDEKIRHRVMR